MKGLNIQKMIDDSLGFLDNNWIRFTLIILIILYIAGGIPLITSDVAYIFHNPLVKIGFIILIIYIAFKDVPLALLLALAFVLSLQMGYRYQLGAQFGVSQTGISAGAKAGLGQLDEDDVNIELKGKIGQNIEGMHMEADHESPDGANYNHYFDCVKDCADGDINKGALDTPCKGVGVWKDELNAQGLNCPLGYSGGKDGAPF